jgi:hypothetical protein
MHGTRSFSPLPRWLQNNFFSFAGKHRHLDKIGRICATTTPVMSRNCTGNE